MQTQSILYGLIGFFIGGLLVAVAATFESDSPASTSHNSSTHSSMTGLENKTGDAFDEAFINGMIEHHQGALDMAKLSATNAKHDEIKQLSKEVIAAQEKEIAQMQQWQKDWGYAVQSGHMQMGH